MSQLTADNALQEKRNGPQGRLLRGYLHKTSNSLCGIKGYASLIAGEAAAETGAARWADRIIREVERLERIFRSVGDLTAPAGPCGATGGLAGTVAAAAAAFGAASPGVRLEVGPLPDVALRLPAADLRLVLRELLANAAEGRDGDRGAAVVSVRAVRQPTGRTALVVRDDGPGMEPELAAQAAEPFVTTKDERPGIGLTRVETLMDMYGLAWHLASAPGRGTTVTLEVTDAAGRNPA